MQNEFTVVRGAAISGDPGAVALAALRVETKITELILKKALPGTTKADIIKAGRELAKEFALPGFDANVRTQVGLIPGFGHFEAQTLRSVRRPLAGSTLPLSFPHWFWAVGPIAINSREFSDLTIPALGGIGETSGETIGASVFAAGVPFVSSGSAGGRGIGELKGVVRLPGEFDLGARITILFEKRFLVERKPALTKRQELGIF